MRTIRSVDDAGAYGVAARPMPQWPVSGAWHEPGAYLDYVYIAAAETSNGADPIVSAQVSVQPSGMGEISAENLTVAGDGMTVSVWMRGGVAGRRYLVRLDLTTASGQVFEVMIGLPVDFSSGTYPLPVPPSSGFGAPITWTILQPLSVLLNRPLFVGLSALF